MDKKYRKEYYINGQLTTYAKFAEIFSSCTYNQKYKIAIMEALEKESTQTIDTPTGKMELQIKQVEYKTEKEKKLEYYMNKYNVSQEAIEHLMNYYRTLKWSEEKATGYIIKLFENGTIQQIQMLKGDK